jgi:uncharacterized protein YceH (UPF0502 family)
MQVRVLGCLVEKQQTTPEQYPLTVNSLRNACNQKSSREPVTAYTEGEVGHTLRELEALKLVKEAWSTRAAKYEQRLSNALGLTGKSMALLCSLMLRGPQTLGELKTHSHRLHEFDDLDDVQYVLDKLAAAEPPLAVLLERQPGQKEARYAHLLCGQPQISAGNSRASSRPAVSGLEQRVVELEAQVAELTARLDELAGS